MAIKLSYGPRPDLGDLAIDTAEELERLRKGMKTGLTSAKRGSKLIKENLIKDSIWDTRLDYFTIFSNAYFQKYSIDISKLDYKESIQHIQNISKKLDSASELKNEELKEIVGFFCGLSVADSLYKEKLQRGWFLSA